MKIAVTNDNIEKTLLETLDANQYEVTKVVEFENVLNELIKNEKHNKPKSNSKYMRNK